LRPFSSYSKDVANNVKSVYKFHDKANSSSVDASLKESLKQFREVLTPEQQNQLQGPGIVPDAATVIRFTAELDAENAKRRSRCVASRLLTVLESIQQFSSIVDTFIQSNPEVAALIWGSVKLALLVRRSYIHQLHVLTMARLRQTFPPILINFRRF
jgi:hypothetical protein